MLRISFETCNSAFGETDEEHPSGDPTPSKEDREVTLRLKQAGAILGISLLDHVISAPGAKYYSFKEEGGIL